VGKFLRRDVGVWRSLSNGGVSARGPKSGEGGGGSCPELAKQCR
jgi:hypothetical protein